METVLQRLEHMLLVQGIGRGDDQRIERLMQKLLDALESGEAVALGDEGARGAGGIADAPDLEAVLEAQEIRHMLDLGDAACADHADPDASHQRAAFLPFSRLPFPRAYATSRLVPRREPDRHKFQEPPMSVGFRLESLSVDRASPINLDRQIYLGLRDLIERRRLTSGTALPSTRLLARDLGLGRNTVIAAYEQLALEGFVVIARRTAPVVKGLPASPPARSAQSPKGGSALSRRGRVMSEQPFHHGEPGVTAFHPGLPDADNFPFNTWSKLVARRTKLARTDLFGSYHIMGYPPLQAAIARYITA